MSPATGAQALAFPRSPSGSLSFRMFLGLPGLTAVRSGWDAAFRRIAHPGLPHFYGWYSAYGRHLLEDPRSLRVFVAYDRGSPVAVFPLVSRVHRFGGVPVRVLELPKSHHVLFGDLVFDRSAACERLLRSFVEYLRNTSTDRWDALVLWNLLGDSSAWSSLRFDPLPRTILEEEDRCHFIPCSSLQQRLDGLSKKFRYTLRRSKASLAQEPSVEYVRARTSAEIAAAFPEFVALEGSGWKGAAGSAIRCDVRRTHFYRSIASDFATLGCAEINLLKAGGECLAGQFCLLVDRCLYVLKLGYDERRSSSKFAPGHVLLEHVLQRCTSDGDVDVVNLVSDAPWFQQWNSESCERHTAVLFNTTPRGLVAYNSMRLKHMLRPAVRKARRVLRRPHVEELPGSSDD